MNPLSYLPFLILYGLSTYRLAIMLSSDLGPFLVFQKLRSWLKKEAKTNKPLRASAVHRGITCIKCDSVWVAIPISAYAYYHRHLWGFVSATGDIFLGAMALSAVAIIINRLSPPK